jgi:hypothetical protein
MFVHADETSTAQGGRVLSQLPYLTCFTAGGVQVPWSAAGFGEYSRRFMLNPPP